MRCANDTEICDNTVDDDCDGYADCDDPDCDGVLDEVCNNGNDDDCDGFADCADEEDCLGALEEVCGTDGNDTVDENCDGAAGFCDALCSREEVCDDGIDQDCDGLSDDDDRDVCDPLWDDGPKPGECKDKCGCDGGPVDLLTRQAYVGPHEDVRIKSPQGGDFDLVFSRVWDSLRAESDDTDDRIVGSRTDQWPHARVLGPGWRHSYDARLILEGDASGEPISVLFSTKGEVERLFYVGTDTYGRVPGRSIEALRSGSTWTVTDDDGTQFEFLEGTATKNHPWGISLPLALEPFPDKAVQKHARLRTIRPQGVTGYRIRLWHEQDANAELSIAPPGACTNVDLASGACDSNRGLLVAVAAEWLDSATWRRGSSIELKYSVTAGTASTSKTQYLLKRVLEGADRDESSSTPTILAEYSYSAGTPSWRNALVDVASCVDRTSGATDISGSTCVSDSGSRLVRYTMGATDEAHLIAKVERPVRTFSWGSTLTVGDEEEFTWDDPGNGFFRVSVQLSPGIELNAPSGADEPDGVMTWGRNGFTKEVTFDAGWPSKTVRCEGVACATLSERQRQPQRLDGSIVGTSPPQPLPGQKTLGNRLTVAPGGETMTLRELTFEGLVTHEIEFVPSGSTIPVMEVDTTSDVDFETVTLTGAITEIRRATRNYFTGSPLRMIASATYTSRDIHNPSVGGVSGGSSTRKFPTLSKAEEDGVDWLFLNGSVSARPVPSNVVGLDSINYYFEVDVFDADSGVDTPASQLASNGLLNESGERQVVWTHHVRTKPGGGKTVRSNRVVVDRAGRTHKSLTHENIGGSYTDELELSESHTVYTTIGSSAAARLRGQPSSALIFPDATSGSSITAWSACSSGAYDAHSRLVCKEVPQTPNNLVISEATVTGPNGARRTTHTTKQGSTTKLQSYEDHFPAGPVFEAGKVGGNKTLTSWSSSADATSGLAPIAIEEQDSAGVQLTLTENVYDAYGRLAEQTVENESSTLRRKTTYSYAFDDSTIEAVNRLKTAPSTYVTRTTTHDPATGDVLEVEEEDGDVVVNSYGTSGADHGRLLSVERNGTPVQSFVYDVDGRVTEIVNGDESVAEYEYAEDGRLAKETLVAAIVSSNTHNRTYEDELVQIGGTGPRYRAQRVTTKRNTMTIRDLRTISDHMGRPLRLCNVTTDATCTSPVVQWFYENKCTTSACSASYDGAYTVEGTSRTATLTKEDYQAGRLSYVKHPAGATFYEYDALGRPTLILTYEGTLPAPSLIDTTKMKAVELSYVTTTGELSKVRYPSGRAVRYEYGTAGYAANEDRRGPSEVYMVTDPNGINTFHRVAAKVVYDVDGMPIQWNWGTDFVNVRQHFVTRDLLGRVTEIKDVSSGTTKTELDYNAYDDDGDVDNIVDQGPLSSILTVATTAPPFTWNFDTDSDRDMLTKWNDVTNNAVHVLTIDEDNGHRVNETVGGTDVYTHTYAGEWNVLRTKSGGDFDHEFRAGTTTSGDTTFLDLKNNASYEVSSISYGTRGDLTSYTLSTGTQTVTRDESMKLWSRTSGGTVDNRYRYGPSGELIDRFLDLDGDKRDEYIYLAGIPIGVTHTESAYPSPVTWWLGVDAQGIPRRVMNRTTAMTQSSRLVMNPWGQAVVTDDRPGVITYGLAALPFRHAGQLAELGSPHMIENRWRVYNPDLGVYLSPDPDHKVSAQSFAGPQAYAYASGRPLRLSDPDGRYARVCKDCDRVRIEIPFTYDTSSFGPGVGGLSAQPSDLVAAAKDDIRTQWNQDVGPFKVRTTLTDGPENTMKFINAGSVFYNGGQCGNAQGNSITINAHAGSYSLQCANAPAHEVGHLLGLEAAHSGHHPDPSNLMYETDTGGVGLTELQIRVVLANAGVRECGCGEIRP